MGASQSGPPKQTDWKDEANARWMAQQMQMPQNYPMPMGGRRRGTDDSAGAAGMASGVTGPWSETPSMGHPLFGGGGGVGGDAARNGSQSAAMTGGEFPSQGRRNSNARSQAGSQATGFPSMGSGFGFTQQQTPGPYGSVWVGRRGGADVYGMPSQHSNWHGGGGFQDNTGYWDG